MGKKAAEIAFEKRLYSQKTSQAVRLNILPPMYLCRAGVVKIYEVKGCYVCRIARCRRPSWDEALLNVPSVSIATLWGKIEDGNVVRLCTRRSHPVDPIPVPSRLRLITARSAMFSAGASFNYHFDLEEKRKGKKKRGGGAPA